MKIQIEQRRGILRANAVKGWFFPNWFNKEHFSAFLDTEVSTREFELWKEYLGHTNIYDKTSELVSDYLNELQGEFNEWKKRK